MKLNGQQSERLSEALRDAFRLPVLDRLVYYKLNRRLSDFTSIETGGDAQQVVYELLRSANSEEWVDELLIAARQASPRNSRLFEFAQAFGLTSTSTQQLERIIVDSNAMFDVQLLRSNIGAREPCVCRIEYSAGGKSRFGTGFLVGPDVILTNHHVIKALLGAHTTASARFDYKNMYDAAGTLIRTSEGRRCAFADAWLIDSSPNSPGGRAPKTDELDYALVRLKERAANDTLDAGADPASPPKRGFIEIPSVAHAHQAGDSLFILQHPSAQPLKLAFDTNSVLGIFDDGLRLRYRTNTEPGSSGSPCFTAGWQLTALHHSGDPDFDPRHQPVYNEGIPIDLIARSIEQHGHGAALGTRKE